MRKLLLSVVLAATATAGFAQKLDDVQEKISKGKYDEAKEKIDKVLADPKNATNANAWYYKGKVYAGLALQDTAGKLGFDAQKEAFDAFVKYQQLDPKNVMMTLDQNVGFFQLYDLSYNQGVKYYNTKEYTKAFEKMKQALEIEGYVSKKGLSYNNFTFPALDTQLVNLTASAAYLAKMEDASIPYFERLADAKLSGKEYKEVYGLLGEYYQKKGDAQKSDKYITLGKELYPNEGDYWLALEFGNPGADTAKRLVRYEELMAKYPSNYNLAIDYATELYNYTYTNDKKPSDYAARQERLGNALRKAISINSTAFANYIMGQHVYQQIYDLDDAARLVRGSTAADVAKRKDLNAKQSAKYEELFPYIQKSYDLYSKDLSTLKANDKANLRRTINQLIDYHQRKKQQDKVTFYQDKLKSL